MSEFRVWVKVWIEERDEGDNFATVFESEAFAISKETARLGEASMVCDLFIVDNSEVELELSCKKLEGLI